MKNIPEQGYAGVIVDDFKIARFTSALNAAGFTDIEVFSNKDKTSLLKIPITPAQAETIKDICTKCETDLAEHRARAERN